MVRGRLVLALALAALSAPVYAEDNGVIADMDRLQFNAPKALGMAELVEGKVGKAVRFAFEKDARSTFFTSRIRGTPEWDRAAGFSFWVKGEAGEGHAGLEFIYDDDYSVRYDLAFPVSGRRWTKVTVAWNDLIPVLPGPKSGPLGPSERNRPSKLSGLWFGKWWYWRDYPAQSFAIDDIRLEPTIDSEGGARRHRAGVSRSRQGRPTPTLRPRRRPPQPPRS